MKFHVYIVLAFILVKLAFCTRCKEHMRGVNPKNLARLENNNINNKSALVKHVYSKNHHMDWNNSKILYNIVTTNHNHSTLH